MIKLTFDIVDVLFYKLRNRFDYTQIIESFVIFNNTNENIVINFNFLEINDSNENVFDIDELLVFDFTIQLNYRLFSL